MDDIDARAVALAARQHSLISLKQYVGLGGDKHRARRRVASGLWLRVRPGVYSIAGHPFTWEARILSSVLASSDGTLASHRTAAVLWNVEDFRRGRPEISVHRHHRPEGLDARIHESTDLHLAAPVLRRGIPTTGLIRTLLDVSSVITLDAAEHAIDDVLRTSPTQWPDLYESLTLHSRRGRNGCGTFRAVLDQRFGDKVITDSWFERMVRRLLLDAGFPEPESQWNIYDGALFVGEVDLAWPGAMVGAELQSKAHHLNPTSFERDPEKLNRIQLLGWHILVFTWKMYKERPQLICDQLAQALARSGAAG